MRKREHEQRQKVSGYVYVLKSDAGEYKIGRTNNIESRIKAHQSQYPFRVSILSIIKTDDMNKLESELHNLYENKQIKGEWFNLDENDVAYIKSLESAQI